MPQIREREIQEQVIGKAKEFGACAAGVADVEAIKKSPSHTVYGKIGDYRTVGNRPGQIRAGDIVWPENARSAIITAVSHSGQKPELDWWIEGYEGGTPGNRKLISIHEKLAGWLDAEHGIKTIKLPYHIESGGILLKDAAVLAGLGCMGKNNMLVNPEFGPRVRLRAMLTEVALPGSGPLDFDPCEDCDTPCRSACPQQAFEARIYSQTDFGIDELPARSGTYSRPLCNRQMKLDEANSETKAIEGRQVPARRISYCRLCEFSCPVGRPSQ